MQRGKNQNVTKITSSITANSNSIATTYTGGSRILGTEFNFVLQSLAAENHQAKIEGGLTQVCTECEP